MRILLVEDDALISKALEKILIDQHYVVDVATNGQMGWEFVEAFAYDLIVLDVVLPRLDGIRFCQRLRENGYHMPVLMLTAQSSSSDKVLGLDAGADDYVVKPFELSELLARIRVLLRRSSLSKPVALEWLDLRLDPGICEVTYRDRELHLTPKEYRLLELFLRNPHRVFSRSAILDHLWSSEEAPSEETVTVHIKDLRQKLKRVSAPTDLIETVYGQGYRLKQLAPSPSTPALTWSPPEKSAIQEQTKAELTLVWENHRGLSSDRLAVLEQAAVEWLENRLENRQRQNAYEAAHKLAGALGIFGFNDASEIAREIEVIFQHETTLEQRTAHYLSDRLAMLRKALERPIFSSQKSQFTCVKSGSTRPLLLVVDDDTALAEQLLQLAETWGISMHLAADLVAIRQIVAESYPPAMGLPSLPPMHESKSQVIHLQKPDVVLLNLSLADATATDLALLAELANQTPPLPVLFLTAEASLGNRVKVAQLIAHSFLEKPLQPEQVLDIVSRVRSQLQAVDAKVMVVDDDPEVLAVMRNLLNPLGLRLTTLG
ncbi:response regulator [Kovacikia minuta CCNUW1]|uniref:response regulator n=1 Tax=Kovacikia minuta TaxID=2931930 RepID=UPI001CCF374B|nr:response regulator [Kovacikia minuta]UBF24303.1 response regulator [Kovacikia minuta CCNUW1]